MAAYIVATFLAMFLGMGYHTGIAFVIGGDSELSDELPGTVAAGATAVPIAWACVWWRRNHCRSRRFSERATSGFAHACVVIGSLLMVSAWMLCVSSYFGPMACRVWWSTPELFAPYVVGVTLAFLGAIVGGSVGHFVQRQTIIHSH